MCNGTRTNIRERERGWHVWVSSRRCPLLVRVCSRNFGKAQKHATQTVQHSKTRYTKISLVEEARTTTDDNNDNTDRTHLNAVNTTPQVRTSTPPHRISNHHASYVPFPPPPISVYFAPSIFRISERLGGRSIPGAILRGPSTPRPQLWQFILLRSYGHHPKRCHIRLMVRFAAVVPSRITEKGSHGSSLRKCNSKLIARVGISCSKCNPAAQKTRSLSIVLLRFAPNEGRTVRQYSRVGSGPKRLISMSSTNQPSLRANATRNGNDMTYSSVIAFNAAFPLYRINIAGRKSRAMYGTEYDLR